MLVDLLTGLLLLTGSGFLLVGGIGVLRLPDFYSRLHAAGIIDTLGMMLILAGLMIQGGFTLITVKLFMVMVLILFTGPSACHALARAALHAGYPAKLDE